MVTTSTRPPVPLTTRSRPPARGIAVAPLVVAVAVGGLVALVAAYLLLPQGSHNLDELVYLNQAEGIRHGQLTYDADTYVPDFRPYLTGVAGDRVVFKYQPLWPRGWPCPRRPPAITGPGWSSRRWPPPRRSGCSAAS
jgi:hypothetical protein